MKPFLRSILHLFTIHVVALLLLTLMRLVFFVCVADKLTPDVLHRTDLYCGAFLRGLWFDNVMACYVMILPLTFVCLAELLGAWRGWMWRAVHVWMGVTYTFVFMASAANTPYYLYFSKLLNASIWNWAEYGTTTLGMLFGESSYWPHMLLFVAVTLLFSVFLWWTRRRASRTACAPASWHHRKWTDWGGMAGCSVVLIGLCGFGIRGRMGYNPIKVSAAYFCSSPVLNNLGVNPAFNLLTSTLDDLRPENRTLHLMPEGKALAQVQQFYGRTGINGISPIARRVVPQGTPTRQNVVVVLMESMSAKLMGTFGNTAGLTPHLDSLYRHSLSFSNFYSAGNHTNHGLYATLYSFPSILFRNAMKGTTIPVYSGLPTVLRSAGYSTLFFMTHESQYDNMNAFFRTNGYEEIYSQENYPREKIVNHFGVPDDYLFTYALPVLRRHAASGRPFFATLLTISNHPPYVVPEAFRDSRLSPDQQIVRYADNCIGQFMQAVSREPWSKNTIFVFLGDHGKEVGAPDCELPESFNHIPLIIQAPGLAPEVRNDFAGQVDVAPTLLGMLRIPYVQNNFGIDLMREHRPAAFYTADKTMAARDASHLYVYNAETKQEFCYDLSAGQHPKPVRHTAVFDSLKNYLFSLLQSTESLVQHGQTTDSPKR